MRTAPLAALIPLLHRAPSTCKVVDHPSIQGARVHGRPTVERPLRFGKVVYSMANRITYQQQLRTRTRNLLLFPSLGLHIVHVSFRVTKPCVVLPLASFL